MAQLSSTNVSGTLGVSGATTINGLTTINSSFRVTDSVSAPVTGNFRLDSTGGNVQIYVNAASTASYSYHTFAQGGVGKWELGCTGSGDPAGASIFYLNPSVQSGATGASLKIDRSGNLIVAGAVSAANIRVPTAQPASLANGDVWLV